MARRRKPLPTDITELRRVFWNRYIVAALRRIHRWWPPSQEAVKKATTAKGIQCAHCKGYFKRGQVHRDHITPVVDPYTGHTTRDDYIDRLLAPSDSYQVLCEDCHKLKTKEENARRRKTKK